MLAGWWEHPSSPLRTGTALATARSQSSSALATITWRSGSHATQSDRRSRPVARQAAMSRRTASMSPRLKSTYTAAPCTVCMEALCAR